MSAVIDGVLDSFVAFQVAHPRTALVVASVTLLCVTIGVLRVIGVRMPFDGPFVPAEPPVSLLESERRSIQAEKDRETERRERAANLRIVSSRMHDDNEAA